MAIPLALAAIAATAGGGVAFASVLPDSVLNDSVGGGTGGGGGLDLNIPWLNIAVVLGGFVVLKTFVETATEELL